MCRVWLLQSSSVQHPDGQSAGLCWWLWHRSTCMCVSCRLVALWCVGGVIERGAHRAARAVSQSRLPRRPGPGTPLEWNAEFDGVWRHVFHALVRDGLMQRTAARVGCVGGLEMQRQAAHSGLCV